MTEDGTILYLFVLPAANAGEFSPFQGFSMNAFSVCHQVRKVCTFPASISELFARREEVIRQRASGVGGYNVMLLEVELFSQFALTDELVCIISDATSRAAVEQRLASYPMPQWLHATTDPKPGKTLSFAKLSRAVLRTWALQLLGTQVTADQQEQLAAKARRVGVWRKRTVNAPSGQHNITTPTELALTSLGFQMNGSTPLDGAADADFANALANNAQQLRRIREEATARWYSIPGTPALIVSVPSVYRHLSARRFPRDAPKSLRFVVAQILRQEQYIAMRRPRETIVPVLNEPLAQVALQTRAAELNCYTTALSVAGASLFCPVLRCPPQTDRVRELLIRLAGVIRGGNATAERISRMAMKVGQTLMETIPEPILNEINRYANQGVKLIGDTPLELLPVNGVPLALRSITSRMPTLPGNLLMRHSLLRRPTILAPTHFQEVLLVRAFTADDPMRRVLTLAVEQFLERCSNPPRLKIVDVKSKEQFVDAFNMFDGALAIFDGHGSQVRQSAEGTISVGSIRFSPFELYGKIRIPPILILSACETHTFEGYESSVASAFLMMGCKSVLGTLAPIDAAKAAMLVGRFIFRLSDFLPYVTQTMPWSQVVSGMLRMTYTTDVLHAMKSRFSLTKEEYEKLHRTVQTAANVDINRSATDWLENALKAIAGVLKRDEAAIQKTWRETCYFTESLRYVHLGQPEHLFVARRKSERNATSQV